jgi:carboxylesterase type B
MPDDFTTIDGEPLYHGAIMQSGGFSAWGSTPMKVAQDQYSDIMTGLGCQIDDVDCLIATSA